MDLITAGHRLAGRGNLHAGASDTAGLPLIGFGLGQLGRRRLQLGQGALQTAIGGNLALVGCLLRTDRAELHALCRFELIKQAGQVQPRTDAQR
ncbi:hypothetical protein D3C78_1642670 [compost metagenome]